MHIRISYNDPSHQPEEILDATTFMRSDTSFIVVKDHVTTFLLKRNVRRVDVTMTDDEVRAMEGFMKQRHADLLMAEATPKPGTPVN